MRVGPTQIKAAKELHLPALLHKIYGKEMHKIGDYYFSDDFPGITFLGNGKGYFTDDNGKHSRDDTIGFIQKRIHKTISFPGVVEMLASNKDDITEDVINSIPVQQLAGNSPVWEPPEPSGERWNKFYGFLAQQGLTRDEIDQLRMEGDAFEATNGNIVFCHYNEDGDIIGHEQISWHYYRKPTALDGSRLEDVIPFVEKLGIDPNNITQQGATFSPPF